MSVQVCRGGPKLCISVFIAAMAKTNLVASGWLALYAIFTSVIAIAFRESFPANYLSHWDERYC
jgi:hypothetical protein